MGTEGFSKIPLRGLANLFMHLGPNTKAQISSAFAEAEDMMNFHNQSVVDQQEKRAISGLVDSPVLTTSTNNRGFDVEWTRLNDKTISMYEIQVSFSTIFSNPDVYRVVDTSFALEGLGTTVYVRVRGIRFNGECGPWSDTATIDAFATSGGPIVYSVGMDHEPAFYISDPAAIYPEPIQELTITPQRQDGGIVVFGSMGFEGGVSFQPGDFIRVTLNEQTLSEVDLETLSPPFGIGFGPTFLSHGDFYTSTADLFNPTLEASSGSSSGSGAHSGWTFSGNGAVGVMEELYPSPEITDSANYTVTGLTPGQSGQSRHLHLQGFNFAVPSGNTVNGIQIRFTGLATGSNIDITKSIPQINKINLIDQTGTDRTTSPVSNVNWPRQLPIVAGSDIGEMTVGDSSYLWGEAAGFWTPAKVNSANFGLSYVARFRVASADAVAAAAIAGGGSTVSTAYLYGVEMTIFSSSATDEARVDVRFFSPLNIGSGLTLTNMTLNAIEFGQVISG